MKPPLITCLTVLCMSTFISACASHESGPQYSDAMVEEKKIGSTLNEKVELDESDIPELAMAQIKKIHPSFSVSEAEKEFKHNKTYLDIEGEVEGREIEFDMLQTEQGWKIVEVQRDLTWDQLPPKVANALTKNSPDFEAKRIIESVQYGTDITIFEFYSVNKDGKESRKEVKLEAGVAAVLDKEWEH